MTQLDALAQVQAGGGARTATFEELAARMAFVEARLTLLERQFGRMLDAPTIAGETPGGPVTLPCDAPGIMGARLYPAELDEAGRLFCWAGSEGPVQFVLPVRPSHSLTCTLHLLPHPSVDFDRLAILVNDEAQPVTMTYPGGGTLDVGFPVAASGAPNLSIILLGVESRRPSKLGENLDDRLLAARFFGATVVYS